MGTRVQIIEAIRAGREAGRRGDRVTTCPHPRTSILRRAWFRGYAEQLPVSTPDSAD